MCRAGPYTRRAPCGGLPAGWRMTDRRACPLWAPPAASPGGWGNARCCIWPWIRRCCGRRIVWCASRVCIVDGPYQWCGPCWNIPAVVLPMRYITGCWKRWLNCCLCRCRVVFTVDRGFADTHLMQHLTRVRVALAHSDQREFLDLSPWKAALQSESYAVGARKGALLASCFHHEE